MTLSIAKEVPVLQEIQTNSDLKTRDSEMLSRKLR
jgi:hypothetical protein